MTTHSPRAGAARQQRQHWQELGHHRAGLGVEPFAPGAAQTLGAALKRTLLGPCPACARTMASLPAQATPLAQDCVCKSAQVRRVQYAVEPTLVARHAGLERLLLDVQTDGTMSPVTAVQAGAWRLIDQLAPLAYLGPPYPWELVDTKTPPCDTTLLAVLNLPVDQLGLPLRAINCLRAENIGLVAELIQCTEASLLRSPNLGRKSLNQIKEALATRGLMLGTVLPG